MPFAFLHLAGRLVDGFLQPGQAIAAFLIAVVKLLADVGQFLADVGEFLPLPLNVGQLILQLGFAQRELFFALQQFGAERFGGRFLLAGAASRRRGPDRIPRPGPCSLASLSLSSALGLLQLGLALLLLLGEGIALALEDGRFSAANRRVPASAAGITVSCRLRRLGGGRFSGQANEDVRGPEGDAVAVMQFDMGRGFAVDENDLGGRQLAQGQTAGPPCQQTEHRRQIVAGHAQIAAGHGADEEVDVGNRKSRRPCRPLDGVPERPPARRPRRVEGAGSKCCVDWECRSVMPATCTGWVVPPPDRRPHATGGLDTICRKLER